jgi:hypothetical protein
MFLRLRHFHVQDDSKLLSWFPWPINGNQVIIYNHPVYSRVDAYNYQ